MSIRVMAWVFDHAPTDDLVDQFVLTLIADRANDEGTDAYPSHGTLARKGRMSRETVVRVVRRLQQIKCEGCGRQLLVVKRGQGKRGTHRYEIGICDCRSHVSQDHRVRRRITPTSDGGAQALRLSITGGCEPASHDPSSTSRTSGTSRARALARDEDEEPGDDMVSVTELLSRVRQKLGIQVPEGGLESLAALPPETGPVSDA